MEIQGEEENIDRVILAIEAGRYVRIENMDSRTIPVDPGRTSIQDGKHVPTDISDPAWGLYPTKRRTSSFERQKQMLEEFLERNAISKAQYEKSLYDLMEKMNH